MKTIKSIFLIVITLCLSVALYGQDYEITMWGLPIGTAEIQQDATGETSFKMESVSFMDNIFPIDMEFYSKYDITDYSVLENRKTVKQGDDKQKFKAIMADENVLIYNGRDSISIKQNTHSLLSLFIRLMNSSVEAIDTKWFDLENEGVLYKTRFLWNDTTSISINNKDVMCDHFRIDLKITDEEKKQFDKTDYFNELFFDINSVRQIWVEKWQKQRRLVKITIKNNLTKLSITIRN